MQEHDLTLTSDTHGHATVIHVAGELDLATVGSLDAELDRWPSASRVVIVLSECTFIDSSALRSIVRAQRASQERGGEVVLVAPSQPAKRVLEVASLDRFVPVFETVADAVNSDH